MKNVTVREKYTILIILCVYRQHFISSVLNPVSYYHDGEDYPPGGMYNRSVLPFRIISRFVKI